MRSELTTGPIVVSDRCDSMGPSAAWSTTTISPSRPSVGRFVSPVAADGDGDGETPGETLGDGLALGDGLGEGEGLGVADGDGLGLGLELELGAVEPDGEGEDADADGDGEGEADELAPALPLALAEGASVGTGVGVGAGGRRPIGSVLISKKPSPVEMTAASRPFDAKTARICSPVTAGSLNRISHFVPPV